MKKVLLVGIFCVWILSIKGQHLDTFKVLISEGELPTEINKSSLTKIKEQTKEIATSQNTKEINSEKKFIIQSNYIIDNMLSNGIVLYGEKLTSYVEKVADELLKNDINLRKQLSFYILKTSEVNAFTTDRGEVFITVGLLAQIENEAQLAFVLSHEIVHFIKKHAKTGFVENEKIDQSKNKYKRTNWDKLLSKSKYSKELEMEADLEGLEIYMKSNYSLKEINAVFYVLQYSHLPIDDILFEKDYFNDEYLAIHSILDNRKVTQIEPIDDEDDKFKDHPNINKRRAIIQNIIESESNDGKQEFINSKKEFIEVQSLARFELSFLYTKSRRYGEAIYNSYLLLKKEPNNKFLKINIGYCLYALSKYKNDSQLEVVLTDFDNIQGESQNVFYFFNEIEKKDLNVLTVKYLWDLKAEITDNKFLNTIAEDAIKEMLMNSGVRKTDFSKAFLVESEENTKDTTSLSKYDKIKKKQKAEGTSYEYAFVKLLATSEFESMINHYENLYVKKAISDDGHNEFDTYKKKKKALGLNKIVMVAPNYRHFNAKRRKIFTEKFVYADAKEEQFINANQTLAKNKKIDLSLINYKQFNSTDEYNDLSLLNDWMEERYNHFNLEIYPYCSMYTDDLINKYGTKHFAWSGIYSFHIGKGGRGSGWGWGLTSTYYGMLWLYSVSSVALLSGGAVIPLIFYFTKSSKLSFYYTYLFDISNYNALLINEKIKSGVPMNFYVLDSFNQIIAKPRIVKQIN